MNILITGATSGIGRQLVLEYLKLGHKVIGIGRNQSSLDELANNGILTYQADITELTELTTITAQIQQDIKHIDLLILNAGTCEYIDDINNFSHKPFVEVMKTNFFGVVNCLEVFLPLLYKSKRPHLVGVSSIATYLPLSRAEAYGASKAAVNYLFESLAIDLAQKNIIVSVVNPGFVSTPLTKRNDFDMPFIIPVEKAAQIIIDGITKQLPEISFPKRLTLPIKILSLLPRKLWRKIGLYFTKK